LKKRLIGIFIIPAFVGSFLLANYFSEHGITLNSQLNKTIYWFESLIDKTTELNKPSTSAKSTITELRPKEQYQHVEAGNARACKETSLGKVKYKKVGDIYTWVDESGITNFSSTPPIKGEFKLINFAGEKVFDYFTLDLNTENLPYDFSQKLTLKLNKLFEVYGQLLDSSSLKKVEINLRVYASKMAFDQIKAKHNMPIGDNTLGFYSHATNQAHLLLSSDVATMRTAIHEAAHAINRGIIGYSPKWLNEGLAEYSEYIEVRGFNGKAYPNKNWTRDGLVSESLLPLNKLLAATSSDWNSALRNRLYATSWAFIFFMMENNQRKGGLAKVIKYEQVNLCDINNIQEVEKALDTPLKYIQKQFNHWQRLNIKPHQI